MCGGGGWGVCVCALEVSARERAGGREGSSIDMYNNDVGKRFRK
jgi:hypothetical protein